MIDLWLKSYVVTTREEVSKELIEKKSSFKYI